MEKIRFGVEDVYIDSFTRRRIYDAFKEIMESGVRHHLQVRKLTKASSVSKERYVVVVSHEL